MEIIIPTSLNEIKLSTFVAWEQSDKTEDDLLKVFCGIDNKDLLSVTDAKEIIQLLTELLNSEVRFFKTFTYKGMEFGFIPNLEKMTGAEYIDYEEFLKNPKDWYKAMSVIYRPIIKKKRNWFDKKSDDLYDIKHYTGIHDFFKDVPVEYFLGANVFFYNLGNDLLSYMMDYSAKIIAQAEAKNGSMKNGDGTFQLEPSLN